MISETKWKGVAAARASAAHLAWRLAAVRQDMPPGWFLFDGPQIATIVKSLNSAGDRP